MKVCMFITSKSPTISHLALSSLSSHFSTSLHTFSKPHLFLTSHDSSVLSSFALIPPSIFCRDINKRYCEHIDIALHLLRPKRLPPPSQPASFSRAHSYRLGPVCLVSLTAPTRADEQRSETLVPCNNATRHNSSSGRIQTLKNISSGLNTLDILQC